MGELPYIFYAGDYAGTVIPEDQWLTCRRDAEAKMQRYERMYRVHYPQPNARGMAICAIAEAIYAYGQLLAGNGPIQSMSVGSVSETRAAGTVVDTSPAEQEAEFYRCARLYADIYRG